MDGINLLGSSEQKGFNTAPLQSDLFAYEMSYPFIIKQRYWVQIVKSGF